MNTITMIMIITLSNETTWKTTTLAPQDSENIDNHSNNVQIMKMVTSIIAFKVILVISISYQKQGLQTFFKTLTKIELCEIVIAIS